MGRAFPAFMGRWGLEPITDVKEPAVFFGCYGGPDARMIRHHQGLAIIVWLGSDFALSGYNAMVRRENIRHVAIGPWLAHDLTTAGIEHRRINLLGSPLISILKPVPLGNAVYAYAPRKQVFSTHMVDALIKELPDVEFIVHEGMSVPQDQMPEVYERCCIGVRFTSHDGGAETVIELGLMGRYCVHNGDAPNSIRWDTVEDAVTAIRRELDRVGETNADLAAAVHSHVQWDDSWLDSEAWS
jgi:hypothetical protein